MAGAVKGKKVSYKVRILDPADVQVGKENAPPKSKGVEEDADTSIGGSSVSRVKEATSWSSDMSLVEETTLVKSSEKVAGKANKSKKETGDEEEERPVERKSSSDPSKKIAFVRAAALYMEEADV
jgi:hypothetical protein